MVESGGAPYSFSIRMDLNQQPTEDLEQEREPKTIRGIGFEYRTKIASKTALVRKFGESRYEIILRDEKPFVMLGPMGDTIVIFIFY